MHFTCMQTKRSTPSILESLNSYTDLYIIAYNLHFGTCWLIFFSASSYIHHNTNTRLAFFLLQRLSRCCFGVSRGAHVCCLSYSMCFHVFLRKLLCPELISIRLCATCRCSEPLTLANDLLYPKMLGGGGRVVFSG